MFRIPALILGGAAAVAMVACGSAAASSAGSPNASPSASGRGFARNGAAGELVQINGQDLILSNANGDTTVTYSASTVVTQTRTGTVSDIVPGVCITATGVKSPSGQVTASVVRVSNPVNGTCQGAFGRGGGGGFGSRTPNPSRTLPPQAANLGFASGQVAANGVNGTSVTVTERSGATTTVTVPTTVRVVMSTVVQPSALQTGECLTAVGSRSASGVVAARSLTIVPAGPSGCSSGFGGGGFGGGGFGGGGFGGGGFGGAFGGGGSAGGGGSGASTTT